MKYSVQSTDFVLFVDKHLDLCYVRGSFPLATGYSKYTGSYENVAWLSSTEKIKKQRKKKPDLGAPFTASRNRPDGDLVGLREIAHSQLSPRVVS